MDLIPINNGLPNDRPLLHQFLDANTDFVRWLEGTRLFHALKQDSVRASTGMNTILRVHTDTGLITFNLNGHIVETAYDLPEEVVAEFMRNYPGENSTNGQLFLNYKP